MYEAFNYMDESQNLVNLLATKDVVEVAINWADTKPVFTAVAPSALVGLIDKKAAYAAYTATKGLAMEKSDAIIDRMLSASKMIAGFTTDDEFIFGHGAAAIKSLGEGMAPLPINRYHNQFLEISSRIGFSALAGSISESQANTFFEIFADVFDVELLDAVENFESDVTLTKISVQAGTDGTYLTYPRFSKYVKNWDLLYEELMLIHVSEYDGLYKPYYGYYSDSADAINYSENSDEANFAGGFSFGFVITEEADQLASHRSRLFDELKLNSQYTTMRNMSMFGDPLDSDDILKNDILSQVRDLDGNLLFRILKDWIVTGPIPFMDEFAVKGKLADCSIVDRNGVLRIEITPDRIYAGAHSSSVAQIYTNLGDAEKVDALTASPSLLRAVMYADPIPVPKDWFESTAAYAAQTTVGSLLGRSANMLDAEVGEGVKIGDIQAHLNALSDINMSVSHVQTVPELVAIAAGTEYIHDWENVVIHLDPIVVDAAISGVSFSVEYDGTTTSIMRTVFESIFLVSGGQVDMISDDGGFSVDQCLTAVYGTSTTYSLLQLMQEAISEEERDSNDYNWSRVFGPLLYPDLKGLVGEQLGKGIVLTEMQDRRVEKFFMGLCVAIAPSDALYGITE